MHAQVYDLAIIGGGINGSGIARDAAGRGLTVFLTEQYDLASGTSSASTKLIHGGLRYLEYYEFRLVREALTEREVLLRAAPHIIWPLRFILPHHKGLRPAWMLRLGLFLYDHLGGRKLLPPTSVVDLASDETGQCLKGNYTKGFEYSDCWVMDSRLVVLNAMDAAARGAHIRTRCRCTSARRQDGLWCLTLTDTESGAESTIQARALVNAAGPWLDMTLEHIEHSATRQHIRMVKGSHIIVRKLFDHPKAYIFQNDDNRIIFAIPYEKEFTLIGTTDVDFHGSPENVTISEEEIAYLCRAAGEYFHVSLSAADVVHHFSGIRPLFDDGKSEAKAATRDYVLKVDEKGGLPLLSIYGGKITTYRKLAESVLAKLAVYFPAMGAPWTDGQPLPGGDFPADGYEREVDRLLAAHPALGHSLAARLVRLYGTRSHSMCSGLTDLASQGRCFGGDLYEFEVKYLVHNEWARTAEDIVRRRTRIGLHVTEAETGTLQSWLTTYMEGVLDA